MRRLLFLFLLILLIHSCTYRDIPRPVDCSVSDLILLEGTKSLPTGCTSDGSVIVIPSGGRQPYLFSINGDSFVQNNSFTGLGSGDYSITVKDADLCQRTITVTIPSVATTLAAALKTIPNTSCPTPNGRIEVSASAGVPPYQYQLNSNGFSSSPTFSALATGTYTVSVKDSKDCVKVFSATVAPISYLTDIAPLLSTYCYGCHKAGTTRDWTTYANVYAVRDKIKARTQSKTSPMPPLSANKPLTQAQIDLIGCWVDAGAPIN